METNDTEKLQLEEKKAYSSWDIFIGFLLAAFSIFVIIRSLMMPTYNAAIYVRPGIVPLIIGISLLGMSIALIIKSIQANSFSLLKEKAVELTKSGEAYRFLVLSIVTMAYIALLDLTDLPFVILTVVFLWVVYIFLKVNIWMSTLLSIICSVAIYYFFTHVFSVPMP